jgi:hypothetical protein
MAAHFKGWTWLLGHELVGRWVLCRPKGRTVMAGLFGVGLTPLEQAGHPHVPILTPTGT